MDGQAPDHRRDKATENHPDLPEDVIATQIAKIDAGVHLLGEDTELDEVAELAIDHNLTAVEHAMNNGADSIYDADRPDSTR